MTGELFQTEASWRDMTTKYYVHDPGLNPFVIKNDIGTISETGMEYED